MTVPTNEINKSTLTAASLALPLDIGQLAQHLHIELNRYIMYSPEDRDQLMREHGLSLLALLDILRPLCQSPEEREHLIRFQRILNLVNAAL
jgi:hypothetical protein